MTTKKIGGFHHITAMAGDASANVNFYTHVLGLRLIKVTVNFDDPGTYHLYYGDQLGSPGSVITFFPWGSNAAAGDRETGITAFTLRIPQGTRLAWEERLKAARIPFVNLARVEGLSLEFHDDSGHKVRLSESGEPLSADKVVIDSPVPAAEQIVELLGVEFTVANSTGTRALLTTMGLEATGDNRYGFTGETEQHIDIVENAALSRHVRMGSSSVHHLAFKVADDAEEAYWQKTLAAAGQGVTEVKDRQYFNSVYMREPGGIILELATMAPGFAVDEPEAELGTHLMLPEQYESNRALIVQHLQPLPMVDYTGVTKNDQ